MSLVVDNRIRGSKIPASTKLRAYFALTKPRVVELLLITTAPVMFLAERGVPDLWLVFWTLVGGALSAGSAGAFNCIIDRDIDRVMKRTQGRPLVTGELSVREAAIFASTLALVSTVVLWVAANPLTALLSVLAIFFYVVVYTLILKRRTSQNIVWGGIAGCFPVLIAWAAVENSLSLTPWILFLVIFLWTPPHYWPLSMKYSDDYNSVGVPMLGAIARNSQVGLQTVLYAWATWAATLLLIPIAPMGWLYTVVAVVSGGWFVFESHRLYADAVREKKVAPMRVFHASITYLTLVFLAVGIDPLITGAVGA